MFQNLAPKHSSSEEPQQKQNEKGKNHKMGSKHHKAGSNSASKKVKHSKNDGLSPAVSSARTLVNEWRLTGLKDISQHQNVLCKGPKFLFFVYWKWRRKMNPLLLSTAQLPQKLNPFSAGFFPALFFNHLLFVDGKKMYLSVLSLAVIGGFLGYGIGEYISS